MSNLLSRLLTTLPVLLALACTSAPAASPESLPDFEAFAEGGEERADTGYVGNRAFEVNATFTSTLRVPMPEMSPSEISDVAKSLRTDPSTAAARAISDQLTEQVKYARNNLKSQKLNLNLEGGSPVLGTITESADGLLIEYSVAVESLVKQKDLEKDGLSIEALVGKTVEATLPAVPTGLFARAGLACATDPDNGKQPPASDVRDDNFFYYWDPTREGCALAPSDLVRATYRVESSFNAKTVFPEFDRLVADKKIDMYAIFGQITHGELGSYDWGFRSFRAMSEGFIEKGFAVVETLPGNRGARLQKRFSSGLTVNITMLTPVDFADNVPREISDAKFKEAIRSSEIFYYNGHAFYGALNVLEDKAAYPSNRYQILFMDACWSYAYYTKQIFRNTATASDPTGYLNVDVINNTEPGITGSEDTASVLYNAIFEGANKTVARKTAVAYSWNNLITYMNLSAEERAAERRQWGTEYPDPEIYGVSGVRTNRFLMSPAR